MDRTHDTSCTDFHLKDLNKFGHCLEEAANAAFPNRLSRYREVHVLLLSWEDDNLGVITEVLELYDLFQQTYIYDVEEWRIPSDHSYKALRKQISSFLDAFEDKEHLLIVYYGGHGFMNDDRQCIWSCTGTPESAEVQWSGLQNLLEHAESDVLVLLDCCAAASSISGTGSGVTEVIAACGFETWAPGVGEHSFTRSLIDELRYWSHSHTLSVAMLHNKVLSRIKYWKPRFGTNGEHEHRKTPIYIVLSNEGKQRSIGLVPRPTKASNHGSPSDSSKSSTEAQSTTDENPSSSSQSSLGQVWPDQEFHSPKVLISLSLEENQWLYTDEWAEWIRSVPALVKYTCIQGIYKSGSTLILLSIPVAIWDLLPKDPAIFFVGFIDSWNLLNSLPPVVASHTSIKAEGKASSNIDPKGREPNIESRLVPTAFSNPIAAKEIHDFEPGEDNGEELAFKEGDDIEIPEQNAALEEEGWRKARVKGQKRLGLAPLEYLNIEEEPSALTPIAKNPALSAPTAPSIYPVPRELQVVDSPMNHMPTPSPWKPDEARVTFNKNLGVYDRDGKTRYRNVGALFLTWMDDDVQYKATEEDKLRQLLEKSFHFRTECFEIPSTRWEMALHKRIADFCYEYDNPEDLAIIYYREHNFTKEAEKFMLAANYEKYRNDGATQLLDGLWNCLQLTRCDHFIILDGSDSAKAWLRKPIGERKFEIMILAAHNVMSSDPDLPISFAKVLNDVMAHLLEDNPDGFQTSHLYREVYHNVAFDKACKPLLFDQSPHNLSRIWLRPQIISNQPKIEEGGAYLKMMLKINAEPDDAMLNDLASHLQRLPHLDQVKFDSLHSPKEQITDFMNTVVQAQKLRPLIRKIVARRQRRRATETDRAALMKLSSTQQNDPAYDWSSATQDAWQTDLGKRKRPTSLSTEQSPPLEKRQRSFQF